MSNLHEISTVRASSQVPVQSGLCQENRGHSRYSMEESFFSFSFLFSALLRRNWNTKLELKCLDLKCSEYKKFWTAYAYDEEYPLFPKVSISVCVCVCVGWAGASCGMWPHSCGMGSGSLTRDRTCPRALGVQRLSQWTTREVPHSLFVPTCLSSFWPRPAPSQPPGNCWSAFCPYRLVCFV